jgi:hypothetical protein
MAFAEILPLDLQTQKTSSRELCRPVSRPCFRGTVPALTPGAAASLKLDRSLATAGALLRRHRNPIKTACTAGPGFIAPAWLQPGSSTESVICSFKSSLRKVSSLRSILRPEARGGLAGAPFTGRRSRLACLGLTEARRAERWQHPL